MVDKSLYLTHALFGKHNLKSMGFGMGKCTCGCYFLAGDRGDGLHAIDYAIGVAESFLHFDRRGKELKKIYEYAKFVRDLAPEEHHPGFAVNPASAMEYVMECALKHPKSYLLGLEKHYDYSQPGFHPGPHNWSIPCRPEAI